jgi:FtsZ-interacting cell division protein YlmF
MSPRVGPHGHPDGCRRAGTAGLAATRELREAEQIIRSVGENRAVVLHTAGACDGEAQRLIDFACGGRADSKSVTGSLARAVSMG